MAVMLRHIQKILDEARKVLGVGMQNPQLKKINVWYGQSDRDVDSYRIGGS